MSKLTEIIVSKEAFSYLEHKLKPKGPFWDLTSVTPDLHVCPQPPDLLWSGKVLGWSTLALGRKFKCSCGFFSKLTESLLLFCQMFLRFWNMIFTFEKVKDKLSKIDYIFVKWSTFKKIEIIFTKVTFIFEYWISFLEIWG